MSALPGTYSGSRRAPHPQRSSGCSAFANEITTHYEALQEKIVRRTSRAAYLNAWLGSAGWAVFAICSMLLMGIAIDQAINGHISAGQIVMALYLVRQRAEPARHDFRRKRTTAPRKTAKRFVWLREHVRLAGGRLVS